MDEHLEEELVPIIKSEDPEQLSELLEKYYPIDIAWALEEVTNEELDTFMESIPSEPLATILEVAEPELQLRMLEQLTFRRASVLFQYMSNDDVVDILGNLPVGTRKKYIKKMRGDSQDEIQVMLNYDPESAGGIMTTEYIALNELLTVEETLEKIREISPSTEVINTLFVTTKENKLIGWLDIRDLFINALDDTLHSIMQTNVITVTPDEDQEVVAQLSTKYDLSVVPVVSHKQVLLGIITIDDIVDVLQEEHQEDMLLMSGVQENEKIGGPILESLKRRTPWLIVNLFTAFLAAGVVSQFQGTIEQVVELAVAMTIISGMGGNAASQTLALVIQGITTGELSLQEDKAYVFKEILLAIMNGLITGAIAAGVLYLNFPNPYYALIILLAMTCNLVIGAVFGFFVPLVLKALRLDPAVASTIFVTTATDVLGFFAILGLASLLIQYLI